MPSSPLDRVLRACACAVALSFVSCVSSPTTELGPYPENDGTIAVGAVLPDLSFEGVDGEGVPATLALADFRRSPEDRELLLVVVNGGAWCGSCLYPRDHADTLLDGLAGRERVTRLDLVIGDRDNAPADQDVAREWHEAITLDGVAVGADPAHRLAPLLEGPHTALPLVAIVDAASLRVLDALSSPPPVELRNALARALATLEGRPAPSPERDVLVDGVFHEDEWALLQTITVPGAPPSDPSNAVADDPAAQALGRALFEDRGLSSSGEQSCASCHAREHALSDGRARARGAGEGTRRTPSIALAAHARWQFWDGRADTLWAQALG
ncbi:MAG: cytochrome-c peroxidase, partial [Sandaracinus sp.]